MKKTLVALVPALLFASCKFWNEPVGEFFSYWASEAYISDWDVRAAHQSDSAGITSIASGADAEVILKAENPKSFRFVMPTAGSAEMIDFTGLSAQPVSGTDYTLTQVSPSALKLTYKSAFLKKHEWGNGDFGAVVTLHADDGRKFKRSYGFNLKANTPPPTPAAVLAQTADPSPSYVLCFQVPDMNLTVNGDALHKDMAAMEINGTEYPLTVNAARTDFIKPADASFIGFSGVTQLTEPGAAPVPSGSWILYYNTGVPLGSSHQTYAVKLKDDKGLVSGTLEAGTTLNEPPEETVTVTAGEQGGGSGTASDPVVIKAAASAPEAQLTIADAAAGTTVHCTVTETGGGHPAQQYDGNPVTVPLGLNGANEKTYKVDYYTDGVGYKSNAQKTKYYKVLKQHTVTFNANGGKYADSSTAHTALVPHNSAASAPSTPPAKTGYAFGAWCTDPAGTSPWNFTTPVTDDLTLYAKWTPNTATQYKVEHYQLNVDGTYPSAAADTDNLTGTTGVSITVAQKTYTGFEFDKQEPAAATIGAEGNTVVKVFYKRKTVTVTFQLDGGTVGGSTSDITETGKFGASLTVPAPVKTGYRLSGWSPALPSPLVFPASDTAYTAQWQRVYKVTFKVDGGEGGKLKGEYNGEAKEAFGSFQMEFMNIPSGGMVNFTAIPNPKKGVKAWTNVTATPPDSETATLSVTGDTTVTVKFYTNTVDGSISSSTAWKKLKEIINEAPAGATVKVKGEIKATNSGSGATANWGQLEIKKNLTIEGSGTSPTLNANSSALVGKEHRIFDVESGKTLALKNLTLKNGKKAGGNGGAIYSNGGTLILENTNIESCTAATGGAISSSGNLTITGGTISKNTATGEGGAIHIKSGELNVTGGTIGGNSSQGNKAKNGGGIYVQGGKMNMTNCTLKGNSATGNNVDADGGAMYIHGATAGITNCIFTGNTAQANGGAVYAVRDGTTGAQVTISGGTIGGTGTDGNTVTHNYGFGGGIFINDRCTLTLQGVQIIGNKAGRAGGVRANKSTVIMTGCTVKDNKTTDVSSLGGGGGVYTNEGMLTMTDCTVTGNEVPSAACGGGMNIEGTTVTMKDCTLTSNTASTPGGGIYFKDGTLTMQGSTCITPSTGSEMNMQGKNDVYLENGKTITVDDTLSPADGTAARITPSTYATTTQVLTGSAVGTKHGKFKVTQQTTPTIKNWKVGSDGKLQMN